MKCDLLQEPKKKFPSIFASIFFQLKNIFLIIVLTLLQISSGFTDPPTDPLLDSLTGQIVLDAKVLTKFQDSLPSPHVITGYKKNASGKTQKLSFHATLTINEFAQQVLPSNFTQGPYGGKTLVWGYNGSYPGPSFEVRRGVPLDLLVENKLINPKLKKFLPIDQTLHWADPLNQMNDMLMAPYEGPVPTVLHLHGGEVETASDGAPDAWYTANFKIKGKGFVDPIHHYPNAQEATTLWYHDHGLGITRLNVYAGLAGFYFIRDPQLEPINLPSGEYERVLLIQDRQFDKDGQFFFPHEGVNPTIHPFWTPEFFGDAIVVNGKVWPYLEVKQARYRFRILNGSNARFYKLRFAKNISFWQIGTDGGLLDQPVKVDELILAPAERADVIVDFSQLAVGDSFLLTNSANAPYPDGDAPDPDTTAQIMQLRVVSHSAQTTTNQFLDPASFPTPQLRPKNPIRRLDPKGLISQKRHLTLVEINTGDQKEPMMEHHRHESIMARNKKKSNFFADPRMPPMTSLTVLVNNLHWHDPISEMMRVGSTEIWEIINLTMDTHPIHLHLIQFQLLERQKFDLEKYSVDYRKSFPGNNFIPASGPPPGGNPDVTSYLMGPPIPPDPNERGWKDTIRVNYGEIAKIIIRIAPTAAPLKGPGAAAPGKNLFLFTPYLQQGQIDPKTGYPVGSVYVWHCHILDHEDNDMMRPFRIVK